MSQSKDPLALALSLAYERALAAREAVEHRLTSIHSQEFLVQRWLNETATIAAEQYPGSDLDSYPVQTRMQREFEKLERYKGEIDNRLVKYSATLKDLENLKKKIITDKERASSLDIKKMLKSWPKILVRDPWPGYWPPQKKMCPREAVFHERFAFRKNKSLPTPPQPSLIPFHINLAGQKIELLARYQEGISLFQADLYALNDRSYTSRWPTILEVIRCGIRWPILDQYLEEAEAPWLPKDFVDEVFGLRGSLTRRDKLADVMNQISKDTAYWYLSNWTGRTVLNEDFNDKDIIEELMSVGLVKWGGDISTYEMIYNIPFPEIKYLFAYADLKIPKSYNIAVDRFNELIKAYGKDEIEWKIKSLVDVSRVIDVLEVDGWDREERLGVRARANVLVSTLIMLDEGDPGPLNIINWNN
ncbi:hypothetical protein AB6T85_21445 [Erwinia sp. ACCC 02193]|uniref:Uncharacterized protein n=1 Tax=Erwinia aeris TaxID=3239803 RepID=A0ABV4EDH9_9GAMM